MGVPINITNTHIYYNGGEKKELRRIHDPYFLVLCSKEGESPAEIRKKVVDEIEKGESDDLNPKKVKGVGEIEVVESFHTAGKCIPAFKVYAYNSGDVPRISDAIFFGLGYYTAEHDIPYHQRALVDLASSNRIWMYDTGGKVEKLRVLVYDLEMTQYARSGGGIEGKIPIDMIGYTSFDISFESSHDLEKEEFNFAFRDAPGDWMGREVIQLFSENPDEEVQNILEFIQVMKGYDVIAGHNLLAFDNLQLYARIEEFLSRERRVCTLSKEEETSLREFKNETLRKDRLFNFGQMVNIIDALPTSFDTYYAARRFYSFLHDFSLKYVAPFLGIEIPDRVKIDYKDLALDEKSKLYHRQDVLEDTGITMLMIQQAIPLCFVCCLPFEQIWPAGTVRLWDHMAMIRASMITSQKKRRKIIPPIIRAYEVARETSRYFPGFCLRTELAECARRDGKARLKEGFIRLVKYGDEMPPWIEYHHILPGDAPQFESDIDTEEPPEDDEDEESAGRRVILPGGFTIHPDEQDTQMLLYWRVVSADVGAMYPTILKAKNIGADTVRLCKPGEEPNYWVWLKWVPKTFLDPEKVLYRPVTDEEPYARGQGYMFGVHIEDPERSPSMVSLAMTGIIRLISQVKKKSKEVDSDPNSPPAEKRKWKMMYASLKALRNAGTHGILAAPTTSGRQFNLFGGGCITTEGQRILSDVVTQLTEGNALVAYGDTDGIYIPCLRSSRDAPDSLYRILGVERPPAVNHEKYVISDPEHVKKIIRDCNEIWRKRLNYPEFELEIDEEDAALFVKHKNYLLWTVKGETLEMTSKGNNFKGSDKPNLARKVLERIMKRVLAENLFWENPHEARTRLIESIVNATEEEIKQTDLTRVSEDDLILIQTVRSPSSYKSVGKHSKKSIFTQRAEAIESLLGFEIKTAIKMRFLVSRYPLPGIENPVKSNVKPIDYMYPAEIMKNKDGSILWEKVDLDWYRWMIRSYVYGAFGIRRDETGLITSATLDTFARGEPRIEKPSEKKKKDQPENQGQTTLARFM